MIDIRERLYWEMVADIVHDDRGTWEFAWMANAVLGVESAEGHRAAADVIRRFLRERLATIRQDWDDATPVGAVEVEAMLADPAWAASVNPHPRAILSALPKADVRYRKLPEELKPLIGHYPIASSGET